MGEKVSIDVPSVFISLLQSRIDAIDKAVFLERLSNLYNSLFFKKIKIKLI